MKLAERVATDDTVRYNPKLSEAARDILKKAWKLEIEPQARSANFRSDVVRRVSR